MKKNILLLLHLLFFTACHKDKDIPEPVQAEWNQGGKDQGGIYKLNNKHGGGLLTISSIQPGSFSVLANYIQP
jgi:hypothetical protein